MNIYYGSQWWSQEAREQGFPRQGFHFHYTPQLEYFSISIGWGRLRLHFSCGWGWRWRSLRS